MLRQKAVSGGGELLGPRLRLPPSADDEACGGDDGVVGSLVLAVEELGTSDRSFNCVLCNDVAGVDACFDVGLR